MSDGSTNTPPTTGPAVPRPPLGGDPRRYAAFGLVIESDLELYGFESSSADAGEADVRVRVRHVPVDVDHDGGRVVRAYAPGTLHGALVSEGRDLDLDPVVGADPRFLAAVVTGELFSVLLRQRGCLVLHGAVVERGGEAVGLVGSSTWGKSTLASAMVARGWRLVADDVLVARGLDQPEGPVDVLPVAPAMRLGEASAAVLGVPTTGERAHSQTTKLQVLRPDQFTRSVARLRGVFFLDPSQAPDHDPIQMTRAEAVVEATRHTRGRALIYAPAYRAAHLAQCTALAQRVPAWRLRRRHGLEHVGDLAAVVERTALERGPA